MVPASMALVFESEIHIIRIIIVTALTISVKKGFISEVNLITFFEVIK